MLHSYVFLSSSVDIFDLSRLDLDFLRKEKSKQKEKEIKWTNSIQLSKSLFVL